MRRVAPARLRRGAGVSRLRRGAVVSRLRRGAGAAGLGAVAVLGSSCGISLQNLPKIGGVSGPTYELTATFANVVNLPANAQVRAGAFSVGTVTSIKVHDFKAIVTMRIKKGTRLSDGTSAAVRFDTPLGEDFVALLPPAGSQGQGPYLTGGSHIPETRTLTAPSVEDTFGALGALLNGGGIDHLQTIIDQTNLAFNGNQTHIRFLLNSLNATVSSFADNTPAIDNALAAIASLSQTLNQGSGTISNAIATLGPAAEVLAGDTGDINALLAQLGRLSTVANQIVTASTSGTVQTVQALKPLLDQLTSVQQELGPALDAIHSAELATPEATPGDYLQVSIGATIQVPPVPSDALPLRKVTVDPPEATQSYDRSGIATLIEGGLP
ncbi:MAG: MCE family protein [Acidimicrobiales bacterium]